MKRYCSPKNKKNSVTCYSDSSLIKMAEEYNKKHPDKIEVTKRDKLGDKDRERIWKTLKRNLRKDAPCEEDYCYLETNMVKNMDDEEIMKRTFVPEKPKEWENSPNEWLSNYDIMDVMKQYEEKSDFIFFGPTPIDFDSRLTFNVCVNEALCSLNIRNVYKKGKKKIGVIFNLDPHTKSGSHWTALFVDMESGGVYYFDSYGIEPPKEVKKLMNKIRLQGNEMIMKDELKLNKKNSNKVNVKIDGSNILRMSGGGKMIKEEDVIQIGGKYKMKVKKVVGDNIEVEGDIPKELDREKYVETYDFREYYNPKRFQYKNSECGMFSMWFIIQFLENREYEDIIKSNINDDYVTKKRDEYYRPNVEKKKGGILDKIF